MTTPLIGILGGIGSGKSSVIREVTDRNLTILDADIVGHEVLQQPEIIDQLIQAFGTEILDGKRIDRSQLGKVVFGGEAEQESRLQTLNSIVHPEIRRRLHEKISQAKTNSDAVILDASLLLEGNWDEHCDALIFVDTPVETRQKRVRENRGWSDDELPRREKNQIDVASKKKRAHYIVDNSGDLADSVEQMTSVIDSILTEFSSQN